MYIDLQNHAKPLLNLAMVQYISIHAFDPNYIDAKSGGSSTSGQSIGFREAYVQFVCECIVNVVGEG